MNEKEGGTEEVTTQKLHNWFGVRHIQYLLFFSAGLFAYGIRIAFNVGIIAMIDAEPASENIPTYLEWTSKKNVMLSAFFWGYVATQIIGGQLSHKYGAKWVLAVTFFLGSLFSILMPYFGAAFGYEGVIACRVIQGLSQGFLFPCVHNLLGKWSPIKERAKACGFSYAGVPLGTVIAMPITGLICNSKSLGWPAAYYLFGALGILWTVVWIIYGSDSPEKHKYISVNERNYITGDIKCDQQKVSQDEKVPTPWIAILTTLPFWAVLVNDCGYSWGYWTLLTEIPSFMQNILNFDIASNSLLSALPYFAFWLLSILLGVVADYFIVKKITTVTLSRKVFNSIATFIPAVTLVSLAFAGGGERVLTVTLLVIAVGSSAGIFSGYMLSNVDLSPNYAGTLMGISGTISNVFSLLAPLSVDAVIYASGYQETDEELWTIVFCAAAGIFVIIGLFFNYASSGEVQPWNSFDFNKEKRTQNKLCNLM